MNAKPLKAGDRVRQLGGGPVMTILWFSQSSGVRCGWTDENLRDHERTFPLGALERIDDGSIKHNTKG